MQQESIPKSRGTDHVKQSNGEGGSENNITISNGRIPSPSQEILIEFGKKLVRDSITQSIEFHKTMLGLTGTFTTLMASAFSILAFGSKDIQIDRAQRIFLVIPVLLMLVSSICFTLGYYPRNVQVNLRVLGTIEKARNELLSARRIWAVFGIVFFVLSILGLLIGLIFFNVG